MYIHMNTPPASGYYLPPLSLNAMKLLLSCLFFCSGASLFRMDFDQALRIACFYGMIIEVESLLWMEADVSSVLFNHRDRGTAFHPTVNPAVRDGINDLLSDSSGVDAAAADPDSRRSTGGGAAAAAALKAAREAAAAWGEEGDVGRNSLGGKTAASSASTSTGWASGADSSSCRDGGSSGSNMDGSSGSNGDRRVRPSFGLGREDLAAEDDEDGISSDDDAFVMPTMLTLENDLIREGSYHVSGMITNGNGNVNNSNQGAGNNTHIADGGSLASTGAVAAMRRFGQRVRQGVTGSAGARSPDSNGGGSGGSGNSGSSDNEGDSRPGPVSPGIGLGRVKDRARAKFAGVIKWAQSPKRGLSPRVGGFAG